MAYRERYHGRGSAVSLAAGVLAAIAAVAAGLVVRTFASGLVLDHPGHRSSHATARTRLGGVAVATGLAAGIVAAAALGRPIAGMAVGAAICGAVGLAEDLAGVPVSGRLVAQVAAAVMALPVIVTALPAWGWLLGICWLVAFTNAFNFMDGIDGMAGAHLVVAGAAWVAVGLIEDVEVLRTVGAISFGCGAGFLPHNFPRASIFMGDLGSYAAGFWLAGGAVAGIAAGVSPLVVVAPLALFAFDTSWTRLGMVRRGENVFAAHRSHLYQRLVRGGWSHAATTAFAAGVSATIAAAALLALVGRPAAVAGVAIGIAALAIYAAVAVRAFGRLSETGA